MNKEDSTLFKGIKGQFFFPERAYIETINIVPTLSNLLSTTKDWNAK